MPAAAGSASPAPLLPHPAHRQSQLHLSLPASEIIIGTPAIIDICLQTGNLLVIAGKTFGITNIIVLDADHNALRDERVLVRREAEVVTRQRGTQRQSYTRPRQRNPQIVAGTSPRLRRATSAAPNAPPRRAASPATRRRHAALSVGQRCDAAERRVKMMFGTRGNIVHRRGVACSGVNRSCAPLRYSPAQFSGMGSRPHLPERYSVQPPKRWRVIMRNFAKRFVKDQSGATAIEYGLIAALVAVGLITAAKTLGAQIGTTFGPVSPAMKNA